MAAPVITLVATEASRRWNRWHYKIVLGTNNYATGGPTIDLTAVTVGAGMSHAVPDYPPKKYQVQFHNTGLGYVPDWTIGTTLANAKMPFYASAGTEVSAGAMPAALQTAEIDFTISLPRGKSQ